MMATDAQFRIASPGQTDHDKMAAYVELIRSVVVSTITDQEDSLHETALVMAAASMFAGSLFGTLIIAGIAKDQDKRRVTEAMSRNFRTGIDVGKARGLRRLTEGWEGSA